MLTTRKPCFPLIKKKRRGHPSALFTSNESSSPHLSPLEILLHFDVKRVRAHCDFNYSNSSPFICKRGPGPQVRTNCQKKIHCLSFQLFIRDREEKLALRHRSRKGSQHTPNAFLTFPGSFSPECPFPKFHSSRKPTSAFKPSHLE